MITIEKDIAGLKFGSNLVTDETTGEIDYAAIDGHAEEILEVAQEFCPVIFTSGAASSGKAYLERNGVDTSRFGSQELAAAGTDEISRAWKEALITRGMVGVQVLANHDQMKRGSVLMQTLLHGIGLGIVYVINENDQENLYEIRRYEEEHEQAQIDQYSSADRQKEPGIDNDLLAARGVVALKEELEAEGFSELRVHLALFTAVGGFLDGEAIRTELRSKDKTSLLQQCDGKSEAGTGGMAFKLEAGFLAAENGISTTIASPRHRFLNVLKGIDVSGQTIPVGTRVLK